MGQRAKSTAPRRDNVAGTAQSARLLYDSVRFERVEDRTEASSVRGSTRSPRTAIYIRSAILSGCNEYIPGNPFAPSRPCPMENFRDEIEPLAVVWLLTGLAGDTSCKHRRRIRTATHRD